MAGYILALTTPSQKPSQSSLATATARAAVCGDSPQPEREQLKATQSGRKDIQGLQGGGGGGESRRLSKQS